MQVPLIPLFPLPSGVLLPGGLMPLHIFEARYRAMVAHLIDQPASHRLIALALLAEGYEPVYQTLAAPIHPAVCVGRLTQYQRLDDGRYNILLTGLWRGRVVEEDSRGRFRLARIDKIDTQVSGFEMVAAELLASVELSARQLVTAGLVEARLLEWLAADSQSSATLIDRLAFYALPQADSAVRQAILEEADLRRRAEHLVRAMQARVIEHQKQPRPPWAGPNWPPGASVN